MKKTKPNQEGITLIALILSIVVLVILAAVAIRGITGEEGIIGTTASSADNYKIAEYKEQVEFTVRNTVLAKATKGQDITLEEIAGGLNNETIWVHDAYANMDEAITNQDILVTTTDGYVYQVYYDKIYGSVFVEYIGRTNGGEFPNIVARYEKNIASIIKTSIENGKNEKIELLYKGEVIENIPDNKEEIRLEVDKYGTGWYIIRVTSDKGQLRYAWIRVTNITDKLIPPVIALTPKEPESKWYKTKPVTVTLTTESPAAKQIHYVLSGATNTEAEGVILQGKTGTFTLENLGRTTITAWTEDGEGFESKIVTKEIRIDDERPSIEHTEDSNKAQVGIWYKDNVEVEITGEDEHSGIDGYMYKVDGEHISYIKRKLGEKLTIEREGTTTIKAKTVDIAGNESEEKTITIHKDTTIPDTAGIRFKSNTINSITVEGQGNDNELGVSGYTFEYRPSGAASTDWRKLSNGVVTTTAGVITYTYTGLSRGSYALRVTVTDAAGNSKISEILNTNTVLNRAPVWSNNGSATGVTRTSMNIVATATDADNDKLTYKFYWSSNTTMPGSPTATSAATAAGTQVSFARTGLGVNTTYYYRIDVTDGIDTTRGTVKSAKTNANNIPTFTNSGTLTSTNGTTASITAAAKDTDGDSLTYTLYWNGSAVQTKTGSSGATVTFSVSGLSADSYTYRIDVKDAYNTRTGTNKTAKRCTEARIITNGCKSCYRYWEMVPKWGDNNNKFYKSRIYWRK